MINNALLIIGQDFTSDERRINWLLKRSGYSVEKKPARQFLEMQGGAQGNVSLIVVSPAVIIDDDLAGVLCEVQVPVVFIDGGKLEELYRRRSQRKDKGDIERQQISFSSSVGISILGSNQIRLPRPEPLIEGERDYYSVTPSDEAIKIVTASNRVVAFGYKPTRSSAGGVLGRERRVGLLLKEDWSGPARSGAVKFTRTGRKIIRAAINWAVGAKEPDEVYQLEWEEIRQRRSRHNDTSDAEGGRPADMVGLALSGGGIRSATFCLGLLQGLNKLKLLGIFDYLSTVSGGGYVGGWWSAWLSRSSTGNDLFPKREQIEPVRWRRSIAQGTEEQVPEGGLSAKSGDPIHHLRLFSNYLTPRKGGLSPDTWRAVAILTRNLMMTWLVLVPILLALVMAGQLYFVLQRDSTTEFFAPAYEFYNTKQKYEEQRQAVVGSFNQERTKVIGSPSSESGLAESGGANLTGNASALTQYETIDKWEKAKLRVLEAEEQDDLKAIEADRSRYLKRRLFLAGAPLLLLAGWIVLMISAWMRSNTTRRPFLDWLAHTIGMITVLILMFLAYKMYREFDTTGPPFTLSDLIKMVETLWKERPGVLIVAALWTAVSIGLWAYTWPREVKKTTDKDRDYKQWRKELRRNKIVRVHATLLVMLVVGAFVFALAGFGHEVADYFWFDPVPRQSLANIVAKSGGWLAVILAIAGSIFTAVKTSPTAGQDKGKQVEPSATSRIIFALTPPLVLLVLGVLLAKFGHWLLSRFNSQLQTGMDKLSAHMDWLTLAVCIAILLSFFFAIYEMRRWREHWEPGRGVLGRLGAYSRIQWSWVLTLFLIGLFVMIIPILLKLIFNMEAPDWFRKVFLGLLVISLGAVTLYFAGYEMRLRTQKKGWLLIRLFIGFGLTIAGLALFWWSHELDFIFDNRYGLLTFAGLLGVPIIVRLFMWQKAWFERSSLKKEILYLEVGVGACLFAGIIYICVLAVDAANYTEVTDRSFFFIGAMLYCAVLTVLEMAFGDHYNVRSVWLLTVAYALLLMFLILSFFVERASITSVGSLTYPGATLGYIALGLLTTALAWTVALGWMVNPNILSLHLFYKNRLVRAYMGASNALRDKQISEAAENDDLFLSDLRNCQRGAPYHLVNTTLNMVGGRDLATAQRHSASFLLSKHFCGSLRTGYRPSTFYMSGRMLLGTAVAVSGAAVSPNMGAKNQTASLAMMMTLLNVRLGYWAPTPNQGSWQLPHARLWPFYTLYEFFSQTNDLSSYCYLTDGGHFDNTGLYSLVERGCRYIVVVDNGADPELSFEDLGDAIRRCRIDFGAEINLDIGQLFKKQDEATKEAFVDRPFITGDISYSDAHLRQLYGGEVPESAPRNGIIVLIKPSLVNPLQAEGRPGISADVRQYARQHTVFPQQGTADQWFDESQFESYRKLGEICAQAVFEKVVADNKLSEGAPMGPEFISRIFNKLRDTKKSARAVHSEQRFE